MSDLLMTQVAQPSAPAAGKSLTFQENTNRRTSVLDDKGVLNVLPSRDLENYLRNGGLWFAQRQAPGTLTTYSNTTGRVLSADGWGVTNENASVQFIRVDTGAAKESNLQAEYYGTWSKITSTGKIVLSQVIEGDETLQLRGSTLRFQVKLKASSAKTVKIGVIQNNTSATVDTIAATFIAAFGANNVDPTLGTNLAFLVPKAGVTGDNCTAGTNAFSCSVTTAWQRFGGVVDAPSDCKNLIVVVWTDTQFVAADTFSMSEASLTDGYEIQDWNPTHITTELAKCQRYYCKTFNVDTNPAQNAGALTGEVRIPSPVGASLAFPAAWTWEFPVTMMKPPTLTLVNPQAANAQVRNQTQAADCTASAVTANGEKRCLIAATTPALTVVGTSILGVHVTADAEI